MYRVNSVSTGYRRFRAAHFRLTELKSIFWLWEPRTVLPRYRRSRLEFLDPPGPQSSKTPCMSAHARIERLAGRILIVVRFFFLLFHIRVIFDVHRVSTPVSRTLPGPLFIVAAPPPVTMKSFGALEGGSRVHARYRERP